jgi:hypothetical protein
MVRIFTSVQFDTTLIINLILIKMKKLLAAPLFLILLTGCHFSKSVNKDLMTGLLTNGNGLSCEDVFLSVNNENINRSTFVYGEKFVLNFSNIEGFVKENDFVFPGMKLDVTSNKGDTVLQAEDLYSDYVNGIKISPLLLTSDITVASPMDPEGEYTLHLKIWDKKGTGTFTASLGFKVTANEKIQVQSVNVKYNLIYLFSKERGIVLPYNKMRLNEKTYFIFDGLSGFKVENDLVYPGFSFKAKDGNGEVIEDNEDLFSEYSEKGLSVSDFNTRVTAYFVLSEKVYKNPVHCELVIWDKKSDARIMASADLVIEE